jgi:hypothetical protein
MDFSVTETAYGRSLMLWRAMPSTANIAIKTQLTVH